MNLQSIIQGIAIVDRRGRFRTEIQSVVADSRKVRPGSVFVAVRGLDSDGHDFVTQAIERGAAAVVVERWDGELDGSLDKRVDIVVVPDTRRALGQLSANFHGHPSRKLNVVGITGTNGKTTVSYILESMVQAAGRSVGVVGTVEARYGGRSVPVRHTTPGAEVLQDILHRMADAEVGHTILEVSSHALDQKRTSGVHFKVACFTNLTQDHLDYHKTMDTYFEAKARLFTEGLARSEAEGRTAVVFVDDPRGQALTERWDGETLRVSLDPSSKAEVVVTEASYGLEGTKATIRTPLGEWKVETRLIGPHNMANVAVATGAAIALGFSKQPITLGLEALERVPGRLERVPGDGPAVFVDYAHTPDALEHVLDALRAHVAGRLIVVFGAGGDRDREKRSAMGKAVAERAHRAFLTSDNPRSEAPEAIAEEVAAGLLEGGFEKAGGEPGNRQFTIELDRQAAIRAAVAEAEAGDVVLVAGKGHEALQVIGDVSYRFDDREVARRALAGEPALELEEVLDEVQAEEVLDEAPAPARAVTETVAVEDVLAVTEAETLDDGGEPEVDPNAVTVPDGPLAAETDPAAPLVVDVEAEPETEAASAETEAASVEPETEAAPAEPETEAAPAEPETEVPSSGPEGEAASDEDEPQDEVEVAVEPEVTLEAADGARTMGDAVEAATPEPVEEEEDK